MVERRGEVEQTAEKDLAPKAIDPWRARGRSFALSYLTDLRAHPRSIHLTPSFSTPSRDLHVTEREMTRLQPYRTSHIGGPWSESAISQFLHSPAALAAVAGCCLLPDVAGIKRDGSLETRLAPYT